MSVKIKRVYAPYEKEDGFRVLIDRLWPRGIKKETSHIDLWMKEAAPANELRKWFNHDPEKWEEFIKQYGAELNKSGALKDLIDTIKTHPAVTLLYASKNEQINQAVALLKLLKQYK